MKKLKLGADEHSIEIICTQQATEELIPLLEDIKRRGDPGHSFGITIDEDSDEGPGEFGFDGDGGSYIKKIFHNGKVHTSSDYGLSESEILVGAVANMAEDHKDMEVVQVGLDKLKIKVKGKTVTLKVS